MAAAETYSPFAPVTTNAPLIQKGKRQDGRFPEECRPLFLKLAPVLSASGSAYLEFKDTKIMCSVYVPPFRMSRYLVVPNPINFKVALF